jgi:hypothetical protein
MGQGVTLISVSYVMHSTVGPSIDTYINTASTASTALKHCNALTHTIQLASTTPSLNTQGNPHSKEGCCARFKKARQPELNYINKVKAHSSSLITLTLTLTLFILII